MYTSSDLRKGEIYTRAELRERFEVGSDTTLNTGVFQPRDSHSIWLFVTEKKTPDRTQYKDQLEGDTLRWDGQQEGRTDQKIIQHILLGLELLVFYRKSKSEYPGAGFKYEGRFRYVAHSGGQPTHFVLKRERA